MKRGVVIAGIVLSAAAALTGWKLAATSRSSAASDAAAHALAAGLQKAITAGLGALEPHRCARLRTAKASPEPPGERPALAEVDPHLELALASAPALIVGVVADARGVIEHLPAVRRAFQARDVHLVLSLGGMGQDEDEIVAALTELAGTWPVVALPGDRESLPGHRAAIRALEPRGVVDGSVVRWIRAGHVLLATLPGAPHGKRLVAGADGCVFTAEDAAAVAQALDHAGAEHLRVVLSHAPPRQEGADATDITTGGIHVGDMALARALRMDGPAAQPADGPAAQPADGPAARFDVLIHGLDASARAVPAQGARDALRPLVLSAGAADGIADIAARGARPPLALVVALPARGAPVTWEHILR